MLDLMRMATGLGEEKEGREIWDSESGVDALEIKAETISMFLAFLVGVHFGLLFSGILLFDGLDILG